MNGVQEFLRKPTVDLALYARNMSVDHVVQRRIPNCSPPHVAYSHFSKQVQQMFQQMKFSTLQITFGTAANGGVSASNQL
jgi:hypothetical protein